ncbi:uncharacterized protein LOC144658647 [Oculina patagonica]
MAASRDVYSEDDNFLIGDDFSTDRHRREARQLHRSEFKTIRREAHFARYRNSFLKCDLDQTIDRIEQGRRLRSAELERAKAAITKQAESRSKVSRHRLNENDTKMYSDTKSNGKLVSNVSTNREAKTKDLGTESRLTRQSQQGFRNSITTLSLSRASSVTGKRACDLAGEIRQVTPSMSTGNGKASSLENHSENAGTADEKEFEMKIPASVSETKSDSEWNSAAKSPSAKSVIEKTSLLNRRKGSATSFQDTDAKKIQTQSAHERWMWKEFDKIMKGFSDFLQIEHKSVNLRSEAAVDKETKLRPPQNVKRNSLNTLSPLYFRHGISDQIAFRF